MAKRLGIVIAIFFALVFLDYIGNVIGGALSSFGSVAFALPSGFPAPGGTVGGLASIDFGDFKKGGSGWNYITQGYGHTSLAYLYVNGWHNGVDIAARYGAPIYSPSDGVVFATGNQDIYCSARGFGRYIAVEDPADNVVLWYAHLGNILVAPGAVIKKGDEIGTVGATGLETGTHLHFSVFQSDGFSMKIKNGCGPDADGRDVDPVPYLQKFGQNS